MSYSFFYIGNNVIYLQAGYKSSKEARDGLKEIASMYMTSEEDKSAGEISVKKNKGLEKLADYNILYKNKKIKFKRLHQNHCKRDSLYFFNPLF